MTVSSGSGSWLTLSRYGGLLALILAGRADRQLTGEQLDGSIDRDLGDPFSNIDPAVAGEGGLVSFALRGSLAGPTGHAAVHQAIRFETFQTGRRRKAIAQGQAAFGPRQRKA
jgi:hypothetical protein